MSVDDTLMCSFQVHSSTNCGMCQSKFLRNIRLLSSTEKLQFIKVLNDLMNYLSLPYDSTIIVYLQSHCLSPFLCPADIITPT